MIIYNKRITEKLTEALGPEVLEMTKSQIRGKLEDGVNEANNLIINANSQSLRDQALRIYYEIKEVDNEFTELYTNENIEEWR